MVLDITAYRQLRRAIGTEGLCDDGETDYESGWVTLYANSDFPGRAHDVPNGRYRAEGSFGFRAGSYSGYGAWREQLALLAGYAPISYTRWGTSEMLASAAVWENPQPGPFMELINFSDCDGTIGTEVSRKLAADFAAFQEKADAHPDDYFRAKYADWRKAFEMASDNGAVEFH